ncbi:MAG TPA: PIN domain-containing protein [Candidatus Acetothermia bacterium]|nr:PIN domain-containing protein [Candidatus Acetothermia bacterium]
MGTRAVEKFLAQHERIGVDTMVFIYHLQDHPTYAPLTYVIFEAWEKGRNFGITSVITMLEILVKPKRDGNFEATRDYEELLTTYPNLSILDVDLQVAILAADLRAKYAIRTPDALQIATAVCAGASGFITNDEQLKQVAEEGIEVLLLDDLVNVDTIPK